MNSEKVIDFYGKVVEENVEVFTNKISSIASEADGLENEESRQIKIMEDMMFVFYDLCKAHEDWSIYERYDSDKLTNFELKTIKEHCEGFPNVQMSCDNIIRDGF